VTVLMMVIMAGQYVAVVPLGEHLCTYNVSTSKAPQPTNNYLIVVLCIHSNNNVYVPIVYSKKNTQVEAVLKFMYSIDYIIIYSNLFIFVLTCSNSLDKNHKPIPLLSFTYESSSI